MSELAVREKTQAVLARIRSDEVRAEIAAALPENVSVDRFIRVAATAFMEDQARQRDPAKWVINTEPASLLTALVKCAQDGLVPDGRQAALTSRGGKAVYQPMIGGFRDIAAEHGWTIRTHAVFEHDLFEYTVEPPLLLHRPVAPGQPRGEVVASYAIARHRDGRREQVVIPKEELAKRRAMATTDSVWAKWEPQQAEKTAGRDIFAELPMDPAEKARLARVYEAAELDGGESTRMIYGQEIVEASPEPPRATEPTGVPDPDPHPPEGTPSGDEGSLGGGEREEVTEVSTTAPAQELTEADEVAALEASLYKAPGGKYGPERDGGALTLGEIHQLPDGEGAAYLSLMLGRGKAGEYRDAIEAFCRSAMPAEYARAMAGRQA